MSNWTVTLLALIMHSVYWILHVDRLPYVEATILEVLRYKTIGPMAMPHFTSKDTEVSGCFIPRGTTVSSNLAYHCRSVTHFSPNRLNVKFHKSCIKFVQFARNICVYDAHIREAIEKNWREQMLIFVRMLIMLNDDILQTGCSRILPLLTV